PNSLFSDDPSHNAFEQFFEPISNVSIDDLAKPGASCFPPKWTPANLRAENVNKWRGEYSRMAGIYLLNRPERVIVADYYLPIIGLAPWIRPGHILFGKSIQQIYCELIVRYLKPVPQVKEQIDEFQARHLGSHPFIAAHVRGSDKRSEL